MSVQPRLLMVLICFVVSTHIENDYLKPTTQLCTFDITDLCTMLPQEEALDILTEFLLQFNYRKVKGIPIINFLFLSQMNMSLKKSNSKHAYDCDYCPCLSDSTDKLRI
jgi:hypothetical protein